jgi:hypothetical protein
MSKYVKGDYRIHKVPGSRGGKGSSKDPADWVRVECVVGGGDCLLNRRERTEVVYQMLKFGHSSREIARITRMSDRSVERHKNRLREVGRL